MPWSLILRLSCTCLWGRHRTWDQRAQNVHVQHGRLHLQKKTRCRYLADRFGWFTGMTICLGTRENAFLHAQHGICTVKQTEGARHATACST